jgi:very-short-patch-repair endonuclease
LGIELDGGVHKEKNQAEYDYDRALLLQDFGVEIIRFWNSEVSKDIERVLSKIQLFIESRM